VHFVFLNHFIAKKLYYAPLGKIDHVLDLGTGTGIWAIDFGNYNYANTTTQLMFYLADKYPEASVLGINICCLGQP
jgi:methylase of polypeptide subunit release factors